MREVDSAERVIARSEVDSAGWRVAGEVDVRSSRWPQMRGVFFR